ncbi:MAG: hypothetical protein HOH58_13600, partial [Opitutaceae bacterium]|nr:hypothetical protein [Opitutaceae bacterium]
MRLINSPLLLRVLLALGMTSWVGAQNVGMAELELVGSELVEGPLTEIFAQHTAEFGIKLDATFRGSYSGILALKSDVADIAFLVENPLGDDLPDSWVSLPLGHLAAFVIAPRELTLDQLTFEDLTQIFGADSAVATTSWGDFGADGRWASVPISAHITTPAEGIAYEIFRHRVLPSPRLKVSVREFDSLESTREALQADEVGIAVVPWWEESDEHFKALLIGSAGGEVAFGPT